MGQSNQQQDVGGAVPYQTLKCGRVTVVLPLVPPHDRHGSVNVLKVSRTWHVQTIGDVFQTAGPVLMIADPAQIQMRAGQLRDVKCIQHARDVERTSVERHQQRGLIQQIEEVVEVVAFTNVCSVPRCQQTITVICASYSRPVVSMSKYEASSK